MLVVDRVDQLARTGLGHGDLVRGANDLLQPAIGYDGAAWATVDPASLLLTSCTPVGFHPYEPQQRLRIFERESRGRHHSTVRRLVRRDPPVSSMRGTSAAPDRADPVAGDLDVGAPVEPDAVADELVAALTVDGRCWGALRLWRTGLGARPFRACDTELVAEISRPLAAGLRRAFRRATAAPDGVDDPPGVVTLDRTARITTASDHARAWLARLGEVVEPAELAGNGAPAVPTGSETGTVSTVLLALAARVGTHGTASAVVAGRGGPVALHGSRLGRRDGRTGSGDAGAEGGIAVVLGHPRPDELTPRVIESYDLTPRERDVTALVLRGRTTVQIARALGVSRYTVQDHLKSIFAKVGVHTRGELADAIHVRLSLPATGDAGGVTRAGGTSRPG
jgi:DNA-binding CsgD family transcriptional regulator